MAGEFKRVPGVRVNVSIGDMLETIDSVAELDAFVACLRNEADGYMTKAHTVEDLQACARRRAEIIREETTRGARRVAEQHKGALRKLGKEKG